MKIKNYRFLLGLNTGFIFNSVIHHAHIYNVSILVIMLVSVVVSFCTPDRDSMNKHHFN